MKNKRRVFGNILRLWLSELNGGAGYRRYLAHQQVNHPDEPILSRADWFRREQDRQWSTIRRCC